MKNINELDQAQLRHELRAMYKDIGYIESLQVLYEILMSANILMDVILEEHKRADK